jgi:hypothetical protein
VSPVGPTAPDPGDLLVPWGPVRATAVDSVVVLPVPVGDEHPSTTWVAWPEVGGAVVLDGFTHAVWEQLDGSTSVADLADELAGAGLPTQLDPLGLVATAVHDLVATGLATTGRDPLPSLPASRRRFATPAEVGGPHRIGHLAVAGPAGPPAGLPSSHPSRTGPDRRIGGSHHLHLTVEGRVVELTVADLAMVDWLGDRAGLASPPDVQPSDIPVVELAPTLPSGFAIAIDGRTVDWADETEGPDRVAAALAAATHAPPPGAVVDLGAGWVATDHGAGSGPPGGRSGTAHRWHPQRWLDGRGDLLVPTAGAHHRWVSKGATRPDDWRAEPVTALSVPRVGRDRAEVLADLASRSRATDRLGALEALAAVVDRVDTGPPPPDHGDPSVALDRLRTGQPWLDHLLALGHTDTLARSVKIGAGGLVTDRWLLWLTPDGDLEDGRIREALRAAGLPADHVDPLVRAIGEGRRLVLGTDGDGPRAGRKLYVEDPARAWWQHVRTRLAGSLTIDPPDPPAADDAADPHDDVQGADVHASPGGDGVLPVFVAWKWWPGAPRVATYWPAPGHDVARVLPDHPGWAEALDAFPIHRGPGPHLLLAESTGRRSLDLVLAEPTWGAALDPLVRRLAAATGLEAPDRDRLRAAVHHEKVARVIGGLDDQGRPLAGLYLEVQTFPKPDAHDPASGGRTP